MDDPQSIAIIWILLLGFLAVISAALVAVSFVRLSALEKMSEEGNHKKAGKLLNLLEDNRRDRILSGLSLLRLFVALVLGVYLFYGLRFFPFLPGTEIFWIIILIVVFVLFGETIPRFLARINPEFSSGLLYPFISLASSVFVPVSSLFEKAVSPITGRFKKQGETNARLTEDEIYRIVDEGHKMGVLEEDEKQMILSIFEFTDTIAREVMVPRVDIIAAQKNDTIADVMDVMIKSGLSRIPIYEDSLDHILGIIYNKDFLHYIKEGRTDVPAVDIARKPPYFVPDTKPVDELLREMQKRSISIAIVVDEYGGTSGLVTIEDLLEEIVGDITDEYDRESPSIIEQPDGSWLVDGATIIEDVNETLDIKVPADEHETIGGFVYGHLRHIPHKGEKMSLENLGIDILVQEIKGQRIRLLHIAKREQDPENGGKEE